MIEIQPHGTILARIDGRCSEKARMVEILGSKLLSSDQLPVDGQCGSYLSLTLAVRVKLEALLDRHTKHDCNFERSLKGRRILVLFDRNDRLACDTNSIGEFLLRHLP
jgi:hypothetical protein